MQGAQIEAAAMELDRQHKVTEAIVKYQEAVEILQSATNACPEDQPDRAALEQHSREVSERRTYLEGLSEGADADLPLEAHINSVELTMTPTTDTGSSGGSSVLGAVAAIGGVAGVLLTRGPIGGLACAAGAAYAATRSDKVGDAARAVGQAGVTGADKAVALNEKYQFTGKVMAVGTATAAKAQDLSSHAVAKVQDLDSQYHISEKAKTVSVATVTKAQELGVATAARTKDLSEKSFAAGVKTVSKAKDLDAQYRITETAKKTADTVSRGFSTGFTVASQTAVQCFQRDRGTSEPTERSFEHEPSQTAESSSSNGASQTESNASPTETCAYQPPAQ